MNRWLFRFDDWSDSENIGPSLSLVNFNSPTICTILNWGTMSTHRLILKFCHVKYEKKDFLYKYYFREILSYYYLFPFRKNFFFQQSYLIVLFAKVFFISFSFKVFKGEFSLKHYSWKNNRYLIFPSLWFLFYAKFLFNISFSFFK